VNDHIGIRQLPQDRIADVIIRGLRPHLLPISQNHHPSQNKSRQYRNAQRYSARHCHARGFNHHMVRRRGKLRQFDQSSRELRSKRATNAPTSYGDQILPFGFDQIFINWQVAEFIDQNCNPPTRSIAQQLVDHRGFARA
jgi:hypothetical protein